MAVVTRRVHSLTPLASFDPGGSMSEIDELRGDRKGKIKSSSKREAGLDVSHHLPSREGTGKNFFLTSSFIGSSFIG